jgi:hypothetical protein
VYHIKTKSQQVRRHCSSKKQLQKNSDFTLAALRALSTHIRLHLVKMVELILILYFREHEAGTII